MEEVEIGTNIKEGTIMAMVDMVGEISTGVEEVDIRRRVVEGRGGMMVDITATTVTTGTNGEALQVVTDPRREAILMMGTKMVTTEGQEMRAAMKGRRGSLDQRRIMSETLKMLKVRLVVYLHLISL